MEIMNRIRSWFAAEQEKLRPLTFGQKVGYITFCQPSTN